MKYYYVEDGRIVKGPMVLPKSDKRISGLRNAPRDALLQAGWIPQVLNGKDQDYDPERQKLVMVSAVVTPTLVQETWDVVPLTAKEYKDKQDRDKDVAQSRSENPELKIMYHIIHGTVPANVTAGGMTEYSEWYNTLRKEKRAKDRADIKAKKDKK